MLFKAADYLLGRLPGTGYVLYAVEANVAG